MTSLESESGRILPLAPNQSTYLSSSTIRVWVHKVMVYQLLLLLFPPRSKSQEPIWCHRRCIHPRRHCLVTGASLFMCHSSIGMTMAKEQWMQTRMPGTRLWTWQTVCIHTVAGRRPVRWSCGVVCKTCQGLLRCINWCPRLRRQCEMLWPSLLRRCISIEGMKWQNWRMNWLPSVQTCRTFREIRCLRCSFRISLLVARSRRWTSG